jgi:hypothetical protein
MLHSLVFVAPLSTFKPKKRHPPFSNNNNNINNKEKMQKKDNVCPFDHSGIHESKEKVCVCVRERGRDRE